MKQSTPAEVEAFTKASEQTADLYFAAVAPLTDEALCYETRAEWVRMISQSVSPEFAGLRQKVPLEPGTIAPIAAARLDTDFRIAPRELTQSMLELRGADRGAFLGVICVTAFDSLVLQAKQAPGNQKVGHIVRNAHRVVGYSEADELKSYEAQAARIAIECSTGFTNGEIDESDWRRSAACKGKTDTFIGPSNEAKALKRER